MFANLMVVFTQNPSEALDSNEDEIQRYLHDNYQLELPVNNITKNTATITIKSDINPERAQATT